MELTTSIKHAYRNFRVAQNYDRERFSSWAGRFFDDLEKKAIKKALQWARCHSNIANVLDIPCGTGRITELLLEQDLLVLGGDISDDMIAVARHKLARFQKRIAFRQLDLERLDLPTASYDLVSCIRLFHHLQTEQRSAYLQEMARVSRKFVLINVSYSSAYYRFRRWVKRTLNQGVSLTSSTDTEIQRETSAAGLKIVASYFVLPFVTEDMILLLEKCNVS